MIKSLHKFWNKSPPIMLGHALWMRFPLYSSWKRSPDSSPFAAGDLVPEFALAAAIRAQRKVDNWGEWKILVPGLARTRSLLNSPYPLALRPVGISLAGVGRLSHVLHVLKRNTMSQWIALACLFIVGGLGMVKATVSPAPAQLLLSPATSTTFQN
jgi:hypothetical protein